MSEKPQGRRDKSLTDKIRDSVREALEALSELLAPPPQMVPVRNPRRPIPRRRR